MAPVETNREKFVATRRNTAHDLFAQFHRHRATSIRAVGTIMDEDDSNEDQKPMPTIEASFDMFRNVMKTGVLYATSRALLHGFTRLDDPEWANSELTLFALRIVFISFRSYTNIICLLFSGPRRSGDWAFTWCAVQRLPYEHRRRGVGIRFNSWNSRIERESGGLLQCALPVSYVVPCVQTKLKSHNEPFPCRLSILSS